MAKLVDGRAYSIITDHLGTPSEVYDEQGKRVWSCQLDIYGKVRELTGERSFIPFRYQGQYDDVETGLYYNRFRYYDCSTGLYISQDPVGLAGNNPNFYAYTFDSNVQIDPLGLTIPHGFKSFGQFNQFGQATQAGFHNAGYSNAASYMQGSAVSGVNSRTDVPFGSHSDFDVAVAQSDLYSRAEELGLGKSGRTGPIDVGSKEAKLLGINDTLEKLSKMAGRPVNVTIFEDVEGVKAKNKNSIRLPSACH